MAVPQSFPAKIYQILENESPDIIQWNENGVSFRIVDHGRFEREIVPKYFRHNQISSVQRQLNLYGFKCISRGEFKRSFFHPKFRRGDWETVKKLTRFVPVKKGSSMTDESSAMEGVVSPEERRLGMPQPPYNSFYYPMPGAAMPSTQPDAAFYNRNFMMGAPAPNSAWPEGWDRQDTRMMGSLPPHFAYSMMMHPAMQHMNGVGLHPTASSNNLARLDPNRQSDLSNRLGFKYGPTGVLAPPENSLLASMELAAKATTPTAAAKLLQAQAQAAQLQAQKAAEVAAVIAPPQFSTSSSSSSSSSTSSSGPSRLTAEMRPKQAVVPGANPEYDFMVEFGMFDGMQLPDLATASAAAASSGANVGVPLGALLRLPTISHAPPTPCHAASSHVAAVTESFSASSSSSSSSSPRHSSDNGDLLSSSEGPVSAALVVTVEADTVPSTQSEEPAALLPAAVSAVPTVSAPVVEVAPLSVKSSCDMACNTLLTYSKIHDALVYRQVDV